MKEIALIIENDILSVLQIDEDIIPQEYYVQGYRFIDDSADMIVLETTDIELHLTIEVIYTYNDERDVFVKQYKKTLSETDVNHAIAELESKLAETDYITSKIKEYEYLNMPITDSMIDKLRGKEELRIQIRELKKLLL